MKYLIRELIYLILLLLSGAQFDEKEMPDYPHLKSPYLRVSESVVENGICSVAGVNVSLSQNK